MRAPSRGMRHWQFALALTLMTVSAWADWPMFRLDPAHTGVVSGASLGQIAEAWSRDLGGSVDSSPAVVGGVVFFAARRGPSGQPTIKVAYQPFASNLPMFIACEKGMFAKRGLKVEPVQIISANSAANAVAITHVARGSFACPVRCVTSRLLSRPRPAG